MAPFTDLPTEIILDIFTQLTCFTDAVHLLSVARRTWSIWQDRGNAQIILNAVAPRCVEHLPAAKRLLRSQSPMLHEPSHVHEVIKRLHYNSCRLAVGIDVYEKHEISWWLIPRRRGWKHPGPHLTTTERSRFIPAWYTMWTCVYESNCQSVLETITLRALHVVREVLINTVQSNVPDPEIDKYTPRLHGLISIVNDALDEKSIRLIRRPFSMYYDESQVSDAYAVPDGFTMVMEEIPDVA